jgi:hypothetical protein
MKYIFMIITIFTVTSCMKSKEEYKQAIHQIQAEEEVQKEEAVERDGSSQRSRGSNDAEGMGMDE